MYPDDQSQRIVEKIIRRLERPRGQRQMYDLYSFTAGPSIADRRAFVIRAEEYGIPQARHRVIILGIRRDRHLPGPELLQPLLDLKIDGGPNVSSIIGSLPKLRSGVSLKKGDLFDTADFSGLSWRDSIVKALNQLAELRPIPDSIFNDLMHTAKRLDDSRNQRRRRHHGDRHGKRCV